MKNFKEVNKNDNGIEMYLCDYSIGDDENGDQILTKFMNIRHRFILNNVERYVQKDFRVDMGNGTYCHEELFGYVQSILKKLSKKFTVHIDNETLNDFWVHNFQVNVVSIYGDSLQKTMEIMEEISRVPYNIKEDFK